MEKSPFQIKVTPIMEYYTKEKGIVYWNWRFYPGGKWHREKTPYPEIPIRLKGKKI